MNLNDFLHLPIGRSVSTDDAQALNKALSEIELRDIPPEKYSLVADYIDFAFLHGTVATNLSDALNNLLDQLKAES